MPPIVARALEAQRRRMAPETIAAHATDVQRSGIAHARIADVDIRKVSPEVGHGVFARSAIARGAFIGEYTGHVRYLNPHHMWDFCRGNGYVFDYPCELSLQRGFVVLDGREAGNFTRFLNHSYKPNVEPRQALMDDGWHTFFVATRDIAPGEQLLINYGRRYWKGRGAPASMSPGSCKASGRRRR